MNETATETADVVKSSLTNTQKIRIAAAATLVVVGAVVVFKSKTVKQDLADATDAVKDAVHEATAD